MILCSIQNKSFSSFPQPKGESKATYFNEGNT